MYEKNVDKAYITILEGNSNVTFAVTDDGSKSYIINEVLQALDETTNLQYMVDMLLSCKYRISQIAYSRLPVYTVNLNLGIVTYSQDFSGRLSGYYDPTKNYMTE